ncbi:subtilisin-like protease SBT1.7 [Phalaenopsis equestris]|uniref:subtilisin-like protease SBT1.7 n=1 Tax=Phalaenopsis equestris TaxID=78828 RepID=UPI0009E54A61|nr:subtilisin-like protease SBT1.7 [Phalaenopsis equestris]
MGAAILNLFVLLFLIFSSHSFPSVHSQQFPITNEGGGIDPTKTPVYIVHVEKPHGISNRPLRLRDLKNWYMSFLPNATLASGESRMVYTYREVITGFAARQSPKEVEAMESLDGFIEANPEKEHYTSTTYTPTFLSLNDKPSNTLWYDSSMGAGQIIGVIDSGISPNHPSFNDNGMPPPPVKWSGKCYWGNARTCNNKLLGAVAFRNGVYPDPYDNDGHGTHVASTAAGNFINNANVTGQAAGIASGMAPRAHLAVYKISFINPSGISVSTDADIYAGIEQAIRDHVDILQMSIGFVKYQLYNSPIVIGSFAAITKGIVPCACMMNMGPTPSILANDAPWILIVGASTFDRKIMASVLLGKGSELAGESAYQPGTFPSTQIPLAFPFDQLSTVKSTGCHLGELKKLNLRDNIVMCYRFGLKDDERGRNVLISGGKAMILLNDMPEGETTKAYAHVLPSSHLNNTDTNVIIEYYSNTANPTAAIKFRGTLFGINSAPAVATFSSRGPSLTNGGIIKPDVIAPGVNILAAWPRTVGPTKSIFNFLSGTSMATSHVSGIVALLRNKYLNWSPAAIKSAIMTTAYTLDRKGNPITDEYEGTSATVFEQGAGHIDPEAATKPGIIYELNYYDYVHYLCGYCKSNSPVQMIIKTKMNCSQVKTIEPEQLNYPSFSVSIGGNITEVQVKRKVTNVGDAGSTYTVDVKDPEGVRVEVTPQTLQFNQVGEEVSYEVKFSLKGGLPKPAAGEVREGRLNWDSGKYYASSPMVVTFV